MASAMNAPISAISSGVGGGMGTFSSPRVYMKNRIIRFLLVLEPESLAG
jgi:hypothetical protein